jgi:6-phospho-3-hexuloisomerase
MAVSNRTDNALKQILDELQRCAAALQTEQLDDAVRRLGGDGCVFCAAAGRSAMGIVGFVTRLSQMKRRAYLVGQPTTPPIGAGDLLLIASASGRTASLLQYARAAKQQGAELLVITADANSPLAERADGVLVLPCPSPKIDGASPATLVSAQPMGSLFEQALLLTLDAMVMTLMDDAHLTCDDLFAHHANLE